MHISNNLQSVTDIASSFAANCSSINELSDKISEVMALIFSVLVVTLLLIEKEITRASKLKSISMNDFPLTKSLGFSLQNKLGKKLEDAMFNQGYMEQYQEVVRASRESFESFEGDKERRRRRGKDVSELSSDGPVERRRSAGRLRSDVGRRRARSQALRRDKLNSQSLRSHLEHSKQSSDTKHQSKVSKSA